MILTSNFNCARYLRIVTVLSVIHTAYNIIIFKCKYDDTIVTEPYGSPNEGLHRSF